jgi:putative transposase
MKNRHSIRLRGHDYSSPGAYFVTICTQNRKCLFGNVKNNKMLLNKYGHIVLEEWLKTINLRANIILDDFIVMPNHFHVIIMLNSHCRGTACRAQKACRAQTITTEQFGKPVSGSIPTIIRSFKSAVTKRINESNNSSGMVIWQRNYHEHIIRNEIELNNIRQYIENNPIKWQSDNYYYQ